MFYKICQYCGHLNSSEKTIKVCENPECRMPIHEGRSFTEKEYLHLQERYLINSTDTPQADVKIDNCLSDYSLVAEDGLRIPLPGGKIIVGRAAVGREELKDLVSISREHLEVEVFKEYIKIKDISKYGTFLNGKVLQKEKWEYAFKDDVLMLVTHPFTIEKEEEKQ